MFTGVKGGALTAGIVPFLGAITSVVLLGLLLFSAAPALRAPLEI